MELVSTETSADGTGLVFSVELDDADILGPVVPAEIVDPAFELGLWLAGLDSFLSLSGYLYAGHAKAAADDFTRHFRLTQTALMLCSKLNINLRRLHAQGAEETASLPAAEELDAFAILLREALILNESLVKTRSPGYGEWKFWSSDLLEKFRLSPAYAALTAYPDEKCLDFLPHRLRTAFEERAEAFASMPDLQVISMRFAKLLRSLDVVGRMLRNDEPLKPALLIFAYLYEQTRDLVTFMNNRLSRFPDETAELFGLLDGASYTVSMELRKVYEEELRSVMGIRPAPSVYARIEAAHALLSESFQHILTGFARLVDPAVTAFDLFSNFQEKLEKSLALREDMWEVLKSVRAAEQSPQKEAIAELRRKLTAFLEEKIRYLFYKDTETFERFSEEVMAIDSEKDLVPILHRFGAYLETLFGQVNMRAVLSEHPFNAEV